MSQNSHKKVKSLKEAPLPPLPFAQDIKEGKKREKVVKDTSGGNVITNDEAFKIIHDMEQMYDKIEKMINDVLESTGWSPASLKSYFENPSHFKSAQEWEKIQKKRKELRDSIKTQKQLQQEEQKPKKSEGTALSKTKERRKFGAQRRHWMPMR